jgi:putative Holliday junction resolvase
LGLDVGEKRIGVAVSDPQGLIATPMAVIDRVEVTSDVMAILRLVRQYEAERIVVGLPRSMDGSIGPQAQRVQGFAGMLAGHSEVPVEHWDERLSTVAAERMMADAGLKAARRKAKRDAAAAALILQGYLDRGQGPRP